MSATNPPPIRAPQSVKGDPELFRYYAELHTFLRLLWERTGGGDDYIEANNPIYGRNLETQALQDDGTSDALATAAFANAIAASGVDGVPVGAIIMWDSATIPTNWNICDGTNGTPDLRDNFVVGAGTTYALDATGGAVTDTSGTPSATTTVDNNADISTVAVGSGTHTHEVDTLPPYFALYYIQRIK